MDRTLKRINGNKEHLSRVLESGDMNTTGVPVPKAPPGGDAGPGESWPDPEGSHFLNMRPLLENGTSPLGLGRLELLSVQSQKTTWVSQTVLKAGVHFLELYHPFRLKQIECGLVKETNSSIKQEVFLGFKFPGKSAVVKIDFEKNKFQVFHKESRTKKKVKFKNGRYRFAVRLWGIGNCLSVNPFYLNQAYSIASFENANYLENCFENVFKKWKLVQDFDLSKIVRKDLESELKETVEVEAKTPVKAAPEEPEGEKKEGGPEEAKVKPAAGSPKKEGPQEKADDKTPVKERTPKVDENEVKEIVKELTGNRQRLLNRLKKLFKTGKDSFLEIEDFIYDEETGCLAVKSEKSNSKILKELNKNLNFFSQKLVIYQILQKIMLDKDIKSENFSLNKLNKSLISFLQKHSHKMLERFSKIEELKVELVRIRSLLDQIRRGETPSEMERLEQESVWSVDLPGSENMLLIDPGRVMKVVPEADGHNNRWNPFAFAALQEDRAFFDLTLREMAVLFENIAWDYLFDNFLLENDNSGNLLRFFQNLLVPGSSLVRGSRVFFFLVKEELRDFIHILAEYLKQRQWVQEAKSMRKVSFSVRKMTESEGFQEVDNAPRPEFAPAEEDDMGLTLLFSNDPQSNQVREEEAEPVASSPRTVVPELFKHLHPVNINGHLVPEESDVIQSILIKIEEAVYMQSNFRVDSSPGPGGNVSQRNAGLENLTRPHSGFHRLFSYLNSSLDSKNFGKLVESGFLSNSGFRTENKHFLGLEPGLRSEELVGRTQDLVERSPGLNRHLSGLPNENISLLDGIRLLPPVRVSRKLLAYSTQNSLDFLVTLDEDLTLGLWSTKYGLANVIRTSLTEPLGVRKVEKLINYAIEKEKVNDRDFYGLNGENQRIVLSTKEKKKPVPNVKVNDPKQLPTAMENAKKKAQEEILKKNIADQLYSMGFNLNQIEKALSECSGADINPDIVIEKILSMKPETTTTKSKCQTSKMVLKPEWACKVCTFVNITAERTEGKLDECQICFTPAGEDAYLTEIFIEEFEKTEELLYANLGKEGESRFESTLKVKTGALETMLNSGDQIIGVDIVEFSRENLLNRFVVAVFFERGGKSLCLLVRLGYSLEMIGRTVFLNKFENKASSYLGHAYIPKGEEELVLGRLLSGDFRHQIHQVFPFVRQNEMMEQTGRLLFELKHKPTSVKLVPLLNNRNSRKDETLAPQEISIPEGTSTLKIDNHFVSEFDTIALVSTRGESMHIYNIVNRAQEFFKNDLQVDISSELNFDSPFQWVSSDNDALLFEYQDRLFKLDLDDSTINCVSRLDPSRESRFVQVKNGQFILENKEGQLTTRTTSDEPTPESKSSGPSKSENKHKIVELIANPAQLLQTLKNTSTVEFSLGPCESLLTYQTSPKDLKSSYFQMVSTERSSSAEIILNSPQKAMTLEVEVFAEIDKKSGLWQNVKSHLTKEYSDLPLPEFAKGDSNLEGGASQGKLALRSTESLGGKHSSKHFISQVFQNDKESYLSNFKNSLLVFESVFDKRLKVNRFVVECPKMWDVGNAAETAVVVFFEDLSQLQTLANLRELGDAQLQCLLRHLSLPHLFIQLEPGTENDFFLDKELQGKYCAFIPLKYKSMERKNGSKLVLTKFFLFGSLTNASAPPRPRSPALRQGFQLSVEEDLPLQINVEDASGARKTLTLTDSPSKSQFWVEAFEEDAHQAKLVCRLQVEVNLPRVRVIALSWSPRVKSPITCTGFRTKVFSERNFGILELKNQLRSGDFSILENGIQKFKESLTRPEMILDFLLLLKFIIGEYSKDVVQVFLAHFDLTHFILTHVVQDFCPQRLHGVTFFLETILGPRTADQFIGSLSKILSSLETSNPTKPGLEFLFDFVSNKFVSNESIDSEKKKKILSILLDLFRKSLTNLAELDSKEIRLLKQLEVDELFQPLVDFTLLDTSAKPATPKPKEVSTPASPNTPKKEGTSKDSQPVEVDSPLIKQLRFESALAREDTLQKGTSISRKYDNFQEVVFLSASECRLSHLWGSLKYSGPVFCFSIRLESFNAFSGKFEFLASKFFDEDFLHSVVVQRQACFGIAVPPSQRNSRLFRIKITLNHLPSITYIEGLHRADFGFEFGCDSSKVSRPLKYVTEVYESEFSKMTEHFNFSLDKGRVHSVRTSEKSGESQTEQKKENVQKDPNLESEDKDPEKVSICESEDYKKLLNIRKEAFALLKELTLGQNKVEEIKAKVTVLGNSYVEQARKVGEQARQLGPEVLQTPRNINFWLFCVSKIDKSLQDHATEWTLEDKGEAFLTELFYLIIEQLLTPSHFLKLESFEGIALRVSKESKQLILKRTLDSFIRLNSDVGFVSGYVKSCEQICSWLKIKGIVTWQYLQTFLSETFFSEEAELSDETDKKLMAYSIVLNQCLPSSGEELNLTAQEISKTLSFVNALLDRNMHKIGQKGLDNVVVLVKSALKSLNKNIEAIDVDTLKRTLFLFIKEKLSASLYEIFNVLVSRFSSKNLVNCLEYFDDVFRDLISEKVLFAEDFSPKEVDLMNFVFFNLLKIQKNLHGHEKTEKASKEKKEEDKEEPVDRKSKILLKRETLNTSIKQERGRLEKRLELLCEVMKTKKAELVNYPKTFMELVKLFTNGVILARSGRYDDKLKAILPGHSRDLQEILSRGVLSPFKDALQAITSISEFADFSRRIVALFTWVMDNSELTQDPFNLKLCLELSDLLREFKEKKTEEGKISVSLKAEQGWRLFKSAMNWLFGEFHLGTGESFREVSHSRMDLFRLVFNCFGLIAETTNSQNKSLLNTMVDNYKALELLGTPEENQESFGKMVEWRLLNGNLKYQKFKNASGQTYSKLLKHFDKIYDIFLTNLQIGKTLIGTLVDRVEGLYVHLLRREAQEKVGLVESYLLNNTSAFVEKHILLVTTNEDLAREFVIEKKGLERVLQLLGKSFENRNKLERTPHLGFLDRVLHQKDKEKKAEGKKAKKQVQWEKDTATLEEEFGKHIQFKHDDFTITNGASITDWQNNKNGRTNPIYTANFKYSRKEVTLRFKMKKTINLRLFKIGFNSSMVNQQYPVGPPQYVQLSLVQVDERGNSTRVNLGLLDFLDDGGFTHYNTRVFYFNPFNLARGSCFEDRLKSLKYTAHFTDFELVIGRPQLNYYDGHSPYLTKKPFEMSQVLINFISVQGCDVSKVDFAAHFAHSLKDSLYNLLSVLFNSEVLSSLLSAFLDSQVRESTGIFPLVARHMDTFIKDFSIDLSKFILSVASKDVDMSRLIFSFLLKGLQEKPEFYDLLEKMMTSGALDYEFLFSFWNSVGMDKMNSKFFEVLSNVLMFRLSDAQARGRLVYFPVNLSFFERLFTKYKELRFNYNIERTFIQALCLLDQKRVLPDFDQSSLLETLQAKDSKALQTLEANVESQKVDNLKSEIIVKMAENILSEKDMNSLMLLGYSCIRIEEAQNIVVSMDLLDKVEGLMDQNLNFLECLLFLKFAMQNDLLLKTLIDRKMDRRLFGYLEKAFDKSKKQEGLDWLAVVKDPKVLNELLTVIFMIFRTSGERVRELESSLFGLLKLNKTNSFFVQHILLEFFNLENLRLVQFEFNADYAKEDLASLEKSRQRANTPKGLRTLPEDSMNAVKLELLESNLGELVDQKTEKLLRNNAWNLVCRTSRDCEDFSGVVSEKLFVKQPLLIFIRMTRDPLNNYLGVFCPRGFEPNKAQNFGSGYIPCSDNCFLFYYSETENRVVGHYSQAQFSKNEKFLEFHSEEDAKMLTLLVDGSEKIMISMDQETQSLVDLYPLKCLSSDPDPHLEFPYEESIAFVEVYQMDVPVGDALTQNKHFIERMTNEIKMKNSVDWVGSMLNSEYVFQLQEEVPFEKMCAILGIRVPKEVNGVSITDTNGVCKLKDLPVGVLKIPSSKRVNFVERKDFEENYNPVYPVFDIFCERGGIRFVLNTIISNENIPFLKSDKPTLANIKETFKSILELESIPGFSGSLIQNKDFLPAVFELFIAGKSSTRKWNEWNMHVSALIFGRLAMILKNSPSNEMRESFLAKNVHKKLLNKLAELTGDICRVFVSDEKLNKKVEQEEDIKETKEETQNFKKEIKKRKGVGYDKEGTGKKWVVTEYLEKKKRKNQIIIELLRLFNNLFPKDHAESEEGEPRGVIYRTVAESCMLPMLESAFKCSSLHEMAKDLELYIEYCNVVVNFAENPDLKALMDKIPRNYQPPQIESLLSVLDKQDKNTQLFRTFATDKNKEGGQAEEEKSMECARVISDMIDRVKAHFSDFGQDAEKQARLERLIGNFDNLGVNEQYKLAIEGRQFGVIDFLKEGGGGKFDHHYKDTISSDTKVLQGAQVVRLAQEIADLTASLPRDSYNAIYVRADENRLDVMKSMIAGAEGTPYANGLFEYHLYLPSNYPAGPPKCNLETTGSGDVRFNPNLYSCGKVCLSLLGTWRGNASENWDPKISNLLQLLLSIQSVVMSEEVYFNEPGYEGEAGTVEGEKKNEGYSNIVRLCNIKYGMLRHLEKPVNGFEQVTRVHFYLKRAVILREVGTWVKMAEQRDSTYSGLVMDHNSKYSNKFQNSKTAYLDALKEEIVKLEKALKELASTFQIRDIFVKKGKKKTRARKKDDKEEQERKKKAREEQQRNLEEMMKKIDVAFEDDGAKREFDAEDATVTDRWSRYIGAMGIEAVRKQAKAKVVIVGMSSLGMEVAKNLTLGGLKHLTLADWRDLDLTDSVGNFFAQDQAGKNRASAVVSKLSQLNYYVKIEAVELSTTESNAEVLKNADVLVICDHFGPVTMPLVREAKAQGVKLISGEMVGVYSRVFVDLGSGFEVNDKNGEEPVDLFVKEIQNNEVIHLAEGSKHNLMDGDFVLLSEVVEKEGDLKSINGTVHQIESMETNLKIKVANLEGRFLQYERGGKVRQMKIPFKMDFKGMGQLEEAPSDQFPWDQNLMIHDFEKMGSSQEVSKCFRVKDRLEVEAKRSFEEMTFNEVKAQLTEEEAKDGDFVKKLRVFSANSFGRFPPMGAFLGGVLSQETIKAITNKFTPIQQLFCTDFEEILTEEFLDEEKVDQILAPDVAKKVEKGCQDKYARLRFLLGEEVFKKVREAKLFMIGSGAIGCELIKNYAMVGLGSAGDGRIILTDPDSIELSNLNRQFLFREKHIGQPKSLVAAKVVEMMNPDYQSTFESKSKPSSISTEKGSRILARLDKICPETEEIYNDDFFETLSICANALDNIKARVYMDQRCVRTHRPLVESGTLGPKGHVQVIVPKMTENYGQVQDANEEGSIPICTLKMFPEETIHCVEWAKDRFDSIFSQTVKSLQRVLEEFLGQKSLGKGNIEFKVIKEAYKMFKSRPESLEDCLRFSRLLFQKYFHNKVRQLIYVYPLDHLTKEGKPFWSLPKRPPSPLEFDAEDKLHCGFVVSYARLMARVWGMDDKPLRSMDLAEALKDLEIPAFVPNDQKAKQMKKENEKENKKEKEEAPEEEDEGEKMEEQEKLVKKFEEMLTKEKELEKISKDLTPEVFEKDEDGNGHIDFMYSCGNLRALNYKLDEMEWIKVKLKAGRIVPALATTTAAVSGLQTVEIIKVLKGVELESYRNCFMNLAINIISLSEPGPMVSHKIHEDLSVTVWDQWHYSFSKTEIPTFKQFLAHILETYKLEVRDVLKGNKPVFLSALNKKEEFGPKKMDEVLDLSVKEKCELNLICVKPGEEKVVEHLPVLIVKFEEKK